MKELQWNTSYSFSFPKDFESDIGIYTVVRNIHKKQLEDEILYEYECAVINNKTEWLEYEKQKELDRLKQITLDMGVDNPKRDIMGYSAFGYMLADKVYNKEMQLGGCPDDMKEEVEKILHEYTEGLKPVHQNEGNSEEV